MKLKKYAHVACLGIVSITYAVEYTFHIYEAALVLATAYGFICLLELYFDE